MMNELEKFEPVKFGSTVYCNVCKKQVEEYRMECENEIMTIHGPCGMMAYEYTGWVTRTYRVRCHGEEWKLTKRAYEPGGSRTEYLKISRDPD